MRAGRVLELTSRRGPEELPNDLRELRRSADESDEAVDVVLSSNMLSVGIDIPRLALMLMVGQPKTTAEYIQATSRVGRGEVRGVVTTLFRSNRARDRSHFETFRGYHEALYRNVEPTSVTPWSLASRERSLAGALVALLRHTMPALAANGAAVAPRPRRRRLRSRRSRPWSTRSLERVALADEDELEDTTSATVGTSARLGSPGRRRSSRRRGAPLRPQRRARTTHCSSDSASRARAGSSPTRCGRSSRTSRSRCASHSRRARMERIKHDLRLSETVSPFGVGAIVDVRGESLIAPDTSWWDKQFAPEIHCERLLDAGLAAAHCARHQPTPAVPARTREGCSTGASRPGDSANDARGCRAPPGRNKGKWKNRCECGGALVPMRYVAVCEKGSHIQDIPWFMWAHRGHDAGVTDSVRFCRAYKELKFVRSATHGEGLGSLQVACNGCGRSRPLSDLVMSGALKRDGIRCGGTQPWEDAAPTDPCEHQLVAVQRGATGNYIAERISALDIPEEAPESTAKLDQIRAHVYFEKVRADNGGPQAEMVAGWIADELGVTVDEVLALGVRRRRAGDDGLGDSGSQGRRVGCVPQEARRSPGRDHSDRTSSSTHGTSRPTDDFPASLTAPLAGPRPGQPSP